MNQATPIHALLFNRAFLYAVNRKGPLSARGHIWMIWSATVFFLHIKGVIDVQAQIWGGNAKSGYQDESMQDNECDNGEPAKMSSREDDSFSENSQVDLDDPGIWIWKSKGVKVAIGII
eukprot:scaffold4329_cov76-Attheya_sp.AAC.2